MPRLRCKASAAAALIFITFALWATLREPAIVDLPVASSVRLAVIVTGDNGWKSIDREIAESLNRAGISVIGIVVPPFLAERRTPAEAAREFTTTLRSDFRRRHAERLLLFGYSRGAGVLPFLANRLPVDLRERIDAIVLIGLEPNIDFKYAPRLLFSRIDDELTIPVLPEVRRLTTEVLCVRGNREVGSLCPELQGKNVVQIVAPGTHHLSGSRAELSMRILSAIYSREGERRRDAARPRRRI